MALCQVPICTYSNILLIRSRDAYTTVLLVDYVSPPYTSVSTCAEQCHQLVGSEPLQIVLSILRHSCFMLLLAEGLLHMGQE